MGKTKSFFLCYDIVIEPDDFVRKVFDLFAEKFRNIEKCVWCEHEGKTWVFVELSKKIKIDGVKSLSIIVNNDRIYPKRMCSKSRILIYFFMLIVGDQYHEYGVNVQEVLNNNKYKVNKIREKYSF